MGMLYRITVGVVRKTVPILEGLGMARFPGTVRVENTNHCNANCITCTRELMKRPTGFMDMGLFRKIVDECAANRVRKLHLHNFGEPMLDKRLVEKIVYARKNGIETRLFTNMSVMTEELASSLVEAGLGKIKISMDGNTPQTFEAIRRGLSYERVVRNIELLLRERERQGKENPRIELVFVETERNYFEREEFVRRWKHRVDGVHITSYHNWAGSLRKEGGGRGRELPCPRIWQTFTVLWDGRVALCCMDYNGDVVLGNLNEESIREIFNGEKLRRIREYHLQGRFHMIPICRDCELRR